MSAGDKPSANLVQRPSVPTRGRDFIENGCQDAVV
jgi:hypothetical protein